MKKQPNGFKKFIQTEEKGSQKKERIRQEKKAMRKETQAYFEKKKEEAKQTRAAGNTTGKAKWGSRGNEGADRIEKKKAARSEESKERIVRTFKKNDGGDRSFKGKRPFKSNDRDNRGNQSEERGGFKKKGGFKKSSGLGPRAFKKAGGYKAMSRDASGFEEKTKGFKKEIPASPKDQDPRSKNPRFSNTDKKSPREEQASRPSQFEKSDKPAFKREGSADKSQKSKSNFASRIEGAGPQAAKGAAKPAPLTGRKKITVEKETEEKPNPVVVNTGNMPLNKFIAHAGVCSRRDAADIVRSGKVVVNGTVITEPGFKVTGKDEIKVNGKKIAVRKNLVYILLNKPKDYITTTDDPQGRKTVLDIIRNATTERVYPIGRLDRNTTGVLLLTNDGELAQKLSHPSYEIKKIYEVTLDKPLTKKDFDTIMAGLTLEDGFVQPDALAYADSKDKTIVGIEIHSGRNRIVRRIFEHMGYDVRNLDRVMYANLTKKNVDRGKWRLLSEKEVRLLKYLNASYTNKNKPARRG